MANRREVLERTMVALADPGVDGVMATLVKCVGVASALGASSAYTWLKLPATDQIERVMAATSLPGPILGGGSRAGPRVGV